MNVDVFLDIFTILIVGVAVIASLGIIIAHWDTDGE
jgi:hypothetical protein